MLNEAGKLEQTPAGNPKPPPHEVYLDWICQAWDSLSTEMIAKSFKGF
jgi:hypothetical protein